MVARPTRRQVFAVNCTAPACHDRGAGPGHSTSEMIQEDMKILELRSDPILRMGVTPERSRREECGEEKHERRMRSTSARLTRGIERTWI